MEIILGPDKDIFPATRKATRAYGFDEIALVPSGVTLDFDLVDTSFELGGLNFATPLIASAMDSVVSPKTAVLMNKLGGLGVLNLLGVQTRYPNPEEILDKIANATSAEYVPLMQKIYQEPVKKDLIKKRIEEIKNQGVVTAVSSTPQMAEEVAEIAVKSGADLFFIQATVVSPEHRSKTFSLNLEEFCRKLKIPVIIGNCVTYKITLDLMKVGVAGVLIGIGPGAACTTRGVLGIGLPMATAIANGTAARDQFFKETKKYVPIIADGGMVVAGDISKALACGADAVMIGSPLAKAEEAPGRGFHWGMATPNATLPRGARIRVSTIGTLKEIILGPAKFDDGSMNLVGALKTSMATLGAGSIKEMQQVEIAIAPSLLTEGKVFQKAQQLGMYK